MSKEPPQSLTDIVTLDVRDRLGPLASAVTFSCERHLGFTAAVTMASEGGGAGHIEFGWDLIYGFELLSQAALANSSCLPEVGNPALESDWYNQLRQAPDWADPGAAFAQILAELGDISLRPTCPIRRDFAQRVRTHMIDFVLYHELGHLWHQHQDGKTFDHEQAMELHADSTATILSYMRAREFRHDTLHWRRAWGLAVSLASYLFGAFNSADTLVCESHPHAAIRLLHARATSVIYPGFDLTHSHWDEFSEDVQVVARHLNIGSAVNPFMAERIRETMTEHLRMLEHFQQQDSHGIDPPQMLVDLMDAARRRRNVQAGAQLHNAADDASHRS